MSFDLNLFLRNIWFPIIRVSLFSVGMAFFIFYFDVEYWEVKLLQIILLVFSIFVIVYSSGLLKNERYLLLDFIRSLKWKRNRVY